MSSLWNHLKDEAVAYIFIVLGLCYVGGHKIADNWEKITDLNINAEWSQSTSFLIYLAIGFVVSVLYTSFVIKPTNDESVDGCFISMMLVLWPLVVILFIPSLVSLLIVKIVEIVDNLRGENL